MAYAALPPSGRAALLGVLAALPMAIYLSDFTVDDALISARYAAHIASGAGYRFNADGPTTDGVTPLGWAVVLAPFAREGPLAALQAAKLVGLAAWLGAAALLGCAVRRAGRHPLRYAALLLVLLSAPLGAWSAAGMETGVVLALGAAAASARSVGRDRLAAVAAGLVAAWRPEALPWALVLSLGPLRIRRETADHRSPAVGSGDPRTSLGSRLGLLGWALGPFLLVALVRLAVFDRPAPLALYAKPSDLAHGWRYALACALLTGPLAIVAWRRLEPWCRGMQAAVAVHFLAVAVAGGDWMPLSRLVVPVLPCVVVAGAHVLDRSRWWIGTPRLALALAGLVFAVVRAGPAAARVGSDRLQILGELGPSLRSARVVAALDVGWVGAATDAAVVDLAGVTDPTIAALPGGHTSKSIPPSLLAARSVDTIVLLLAREQPLAEPWPKSRFARLVEHQLAGHPSMAEQYEVLAKSEHPRLPYVVVRSCQEVSGHGACAWRR
jgi:hypothetical protein